MADQPAKFTQRWTLAATEWLLAALGLLFILAVASVPLEPRQQAWFAGSTVVVFLALNRGSGRFATLMLVALSLAVSLRYMIWRASETLQFDSWTETALGTGLLLAELYAVVVLALGYVQSAWPLDRKPQPLPDDPDTWPSVDVYVPTYNEPLSVVRATVLAAMAIDWPPDKLSVYLLDDGRRAEFAAFAEQVGCRYLTRPDNQHAKAGNLNAALRRTSGEFVAVFDCDHIPTRAFLQMTLGWLVADPKLAVVQTPHHFYSPDPFQRNLAAGTRVPAEGNMFHGSVQNGNDAWNAAFFCGSAGVIRRAALDSIGGFATETLTEDAHTMLKLHRRGWRSAYLRAPLAAGLATERLAAHIAQRKRWARGMLQILRTDNPLFGPGLTLGQRLCYLQATGHFLFAIPRVAFLTAPLAFLLLGQNVIAASPLAISAYALPHLFHAVATNSRLHCNWRHAFWSGIYETVLALFLVRTTLMTLLAPRRGRFHVTPKGGLLANDFFDLHAVYPNLILAALLIAGILRGVVGLAFLDVGRLTFQALLLNAIWASVSLIVVLAALAVGREVRQPRARALVAARLPVRILLADGRALSGITGELSQAGGTANVVWPDGARPDGVSGPADIQMLFTLGSETLALPARVVRWDDGGLQVDWQPTTLEEEARVVRAVFGRADAWADWASYEADRPLVSLWRVIASVRGLLRPRGPGVARAATAALLAVLFVVVPAQAQQSPTPRKPPAGGTTVRVIPQTVAPLPAPTATPPPAAAPDPAQAAAPAAIPRAKTRRAIYNLHQFGAAAPLALRGIAPLQGVDFGVRADEVVTSAQLSLTGAMSPSLLADVSSITITLNDQFVGTVPVHPTQPNFTLDLPVSPVFFQDSNRLNFRLAGRTVPDCGDPLSGLLWGTVSDTSTLTLTLERLPPQRDLARLPQPFFDGFPKDMLALPFVLPGSTGTETLRAAGIVASWFGELAASRGANFPVLSEPPVEGNAVVVVVGSDGRDIAGMPAVDGPTLAVIANPNDRLASLLVIAGRNGAETVTAAEALAVASHTLGGTVAVVRAPQWAARQPYDAPNWIATNRKVKLGELVAASDLQSSGYVGTLRVPFRTAPDFYTWRDRPFDLDIRFRAPAGPIVDVAPSRLDVGFDGAYLRSLSLALSPSAAHVDLPAFQVTGADTLEFAFDARPLHREACAGAPQDLRMAVDPDSTIDLSAGYRFTQLPNLAFFATSGFPFTRMADLSETAVVLPERPNGIEIGAFLNLMGRFGALAGLPALRVAVTGPEGIAAYADRDLLVVGTLPRLGVAGDLLRHAAARPEGNRLAVTFSDPLDPVRRLFDDRIGAERDRATAAMSAAVFESSALLVGGESPLRAGRSVVAVLGGSPQALEAATTSLRDGTQTPQIQGDLALLTGGKVSSYRVTAPYTVGSLPFWLWPSWYLREQPLSLLIVLLVGCAMLGGAMYWAMRRRAAARLHLDHPAP